MALRLRGATSGYIELKAPASAGDNTLTLPVNNGSANQILKTDGSGNLSWSSVFAGTLTTTDSCQVGDLTVLNTTPDLRLQDSDSTGNNTEHTIYFKDSTGANQMNIGSPFGEQHLRIKYNTTDLVKIQTDGKVGIGTTSPSTPFHVKHATTNGVATFESGDTICLINFKDNSTSSGVGIGATGNDLKLVTGDVNRVTVLNTGNVGIGTESPGLPLHVKHATSNGILKVESGDSNCGITIADNSGQVSVRAIGNDLTFNTSVSETERMRIDSDGDLWFGLTPVTHHNNRHVFFHNASDNLISITAGSSATAGIVFGDSAANTTANYEGYIAYYNVNDSLYLYTDQGNKGLELKKAGDVHVINGNLVLADTHGIDFSATGAGNATSSESELLDDYEEGNHLVTDPGGNWTIGTGSGAYKYIRYIKIGNQCTVMGQVYCGAGSGVLKFTLPFAVGFNGATIGGAAQDLGYTNGAIRLYQWDVPDNVVTASMMCYNGQTYSQINLSFDNANSSTLDGDNGAYVSYSLTYPTA